LRSNKKLRHTALFAHSRRSVGQNPPNPGFASFAARAVHSCSGRLNSVDVVALDKLVGQHNAEKWRLSFQGRPLALRGGGGVLKPQKPEEAVTFL
jgi:hypothetical protein